MLDHDAKEETAGGKPAPAMATKLALAAVVGLALVFSYVQQPLTAPLPNTVHLVDMTWVEVRSAVERGYTTVIVPTGGIEQNGAHMILGKHDHIVRSTAERIAAELGRTLVAPVVSFVPEGDYDPPSGHLLFPGTIGVTDTVFAQLIDGIARSLKAAGFRTICFIGDHGESQKPQAEVAAQLSREWAAQGIKVIQVGDYYAADEAPTQLLLGEGETPASIGTHAGIVDTSELLAVHPAGVDLGKLADLSFRREPTGANGDPTKATIERGKALLALKVQAAVKQIRNARDSKLSQGQAR